jgi:hypothetical protein
LTSAASSSTLRVLVGEAASLATTNKRKVTVLLTPEEWARFDAYCRREGYKKSTLLEKVVRDLIKDEPRVAGQSGGAHDAHD